jgi:two-component system cell cycle sensor histidine kinase/response regulator CckA
LGIQVTAAGEASQTGYRQTLASHGGGSLESKLGSQDLTADRYRLLFASTVDYAVFHLSLDGVIATWNIGAERIFGFEASEIIGRHCSVLFTPEDTFQRVPEREAQLASESGRAEDSRWHVRKDGSRFWANGVMVGLRDGAGNVVSLAKIVRDDTERRQAEELLQYQIGLADAITTNAAEAMILVNNEGCITFVNPMAVSMFGWSREEMVGKPLHEKLRCQRADGTRFPKEDCPHMRVLATGETLRSQEDYLFHRDGRTVPISCSVAPIRSHNFIAGAVMVVRDLTEEKQAEALQRDNEEALQQAQKLESIGVLAGGIAHDFNNLLTGIMGNAGLARKAIAAGRSEHSAKLLGDVLTASERAADLTRQLLAYAGKGRFLILPVDLGKLVGEVSGLIRASISKKITLVIDVPDDCPVVEADRAQIQQLVMNLVINGGEAIGDQPGTLTVRVRTQHLTERRQQPRTEGFPIAAGDYVRIDVSDTGEGMTPETRSRIFEPFFTTKFLGRGLGLSAALGIVRGHRGAISVRSEPDRGTTFTVLLPVRRDLRRPERPSGRVRLEADLQGAGTILVADDEEDVRSLAVNVLESAGYTVEVARDGSEAIERLRTMRDSVRLILLDLTMPILGGAEAAAELRRLQPDVPIVVMSGYGDIEVMQHFGEVTIDDFLAKPFTPDELAGKIKGILSAVTD